MVQTGRMSSRAALRFARSRKLTKSAIEERDLRNLPLLSRPLWKKNPHPRDVRVVYHRGRFVIDNELCWDDDGDGGGDDGDDTDSTDADEDGAVNARCPMQYTTVEEHVNQYFEDAFDQNAWAETLSNRDAGKYVDMTAVGVRSYWRRHELDARSRKRLKDALHVAMRAYFDARDISVRIAPPELIYFAQFQQYARRKAWRPYRNDWPVFDDERGLVGCLDAAYKSRGGGLVLVVWKRQRQIRKKNTADRAGEPLQRCADCDFVRYGLHLHLYKYILETYYDQKVIKMFIVAMYHPFHQGIDRNVHKVPNRIRWRNDRRKVLRTRKQFKPPPPRNPNQKRSRESSGSDSDDDSQQGRRRSDERRENSLKNSLDEDAYEDAADDFTNTYDDDSDSPVPRSGHKSRECALQSNLGGIDGSGASSKSKNTGATCSLQSDRGGINGPGASKTRQSARGSRRIRTTSDALCSLQSRGVTPVPSASQTRKKKGGVT